MCGKQGKTVVRPSMKYGDKVYIGSEIFIYTGWTCNGRFSFKSIDGLVRRMLTKQQFDNLVKLNPPEQK